MNKKTIFTLIVLAGVVLAGVYFLKIKKNDTDSTLLNYQEPDPHFFDKSSVKQGDIVVKILDDSFEPQTLNIKKGTKVIFVNVTKDYAWPASNPHPTHTDYPGFDPELPMKAGQAWAFSFNKVGNWGYHDHLNPAKRGTIKVTE